MAKNFLHDLFFGKSSTVAKSSNTKPFIQKTIDLETIEGINAIPAYTRNYFSGKPMYYALQRKATEHKKNGKMDLAIACLRKSNEISDFSTQPLLSEKDYMRLIKYIQLTGDADLAKQEEDKLYQRHPEFKDKRISNLHNIKDCIKHNLDRNNDCVLLSTNNHCPICKKYNLRVYSITGKTKKYEKLPIEITRDGGFCPNCIIGMSTYYDGINSPPKNK